MGSSPRPGHLWQKEISAFFSHPLLAEIGRRYGKSLTTGGPALECAAGGISVIPKTTHCQYMKQNLDIWNFQLTEEEMAQVGSLDLGHSEIVDVSNPTFIRNLHYWKIHA